MGAVKEKQDDVWEERKQVNHSATNFVPEDRSYNLPASPFPSFVHRAALYLCMSIPALQIGSSVQFA